MKLVKFLIIGFGILFIQKNNAVIIEINKGLLVKKVTLEYWNPTLGDKKNYSHEDLDNKQNVFDLGEAQNEKEQVVGRIFFYRYLDKPILSTGIIPLENDSKYIISDTPFANAQLSYFGDDESTGLYYYSSKIGQAAAAPQASKPAKAGGGSSDKYLVGGGGGASAT